MKSILPFLIFLSLCSFRSGVLVANEGLAARYLSDRKLVFMENKGQITDQFGNKRSDIDFRLSSGNVNVFIGPGHVHYQWVDVDRNAVRYFDDSDAADATYSIYRMDMQLLGASAAAFLYKENASAYVERYYNGAGAGTGIVSKGYEKLVYKNLYPGIDWELYIKNGKLEQDFVVHPGASVASIKMQYSGATELKVKDDGSFEASTPFGKVSEAAPYSYLSSGAVVGSKYLLQGNVLGFTTDAFVGTLTIDPTLSWGTYIGDAGYGESVEDMEFGLNGELYVVGDANAATNIATVGSHQVTYGGNTDGYMLKFNKQGQVLWGTYYGGSGSDRFQSVAVDSLGYVYAAGRTSSATDIATPGAHQPVWGGSNDAFFAKFDTSGMRIFGSYYGGTGSDGSHTKISVSGNAFYLSGYTTSTAGIATVGAHQTTRSGSADLFMAKFQLDGTRLWGTYFGGEKADGGLNSLACDAFGNVYLFGNTKSLGGIATANAQQPALAGLEDHFLAKFNSSGVLQWATYIGGPDQELAHYSSRNIACDALGNIYVSGPTQSQSGISTAGAHQPSFGGDIDIYLAKYNSDGLKLWATYYGGSGQEEFPSVHVVDTHIVYINGATSSDTGIATPDAYRTQLSGGSFFGDGFFARFDNQGQRTNGSYFGGSGTDGVRRVLVDNDGYVYLGGMTNSIDGITTPGSHQPDYPGSFYWNAYVARLCYEVPAVNIQITGPDSVCKFVQNTFSVASFEDASDYIWTLPQGWTGASNTNTIDLSSSDQGGVIGVQVVRCGDTSALVQFPVYVFPADAATISLDDMVLSASGSYVSYQWLLEGQEIPGAGTATISVTENGNYQVVTVNAHGCVDTSEVFTVTSVSINDDINLLSNRISIYPNPTAHTLFVNVPATVTVNLSTIEGKLLQHGKGSRSIDLSSYAPGMYLVTLKTEDGRFIKSEKVIKSK